MENFFKMLMYVTIKAFGNMLIGIGYLMSSYTILVILFCGFNCLVASHSLLSLILGFIVSIIGSIIREDNEKNKPKS
jgi:hypothetical protein